MIVAPYYHGFDVIFGMQNGVVPVTVTVPLEDALSLKEMDYLETAYQSSTVPIKAVVFCNPHNPLARCYPREVLEAYCHFCEKHDLHLMSDEIYAMSTFPSTDVPAPEPFVSALSLDLASMGVNPGRLHVLYGMSKDFNSNGFRIGTLVSQHNPFLLRAMGVSAIFNLVSSPADVLWATLLNDEDYLPVFLKKNRKALREAYEHLAGWLKFHGIPSAPANAGHFLMADWREVLLDIKYVQLLSIEEKDDIRAREKKLFGLFAANKVLTLAGSTLHAPEGGWFRMTFAIRRDYLDVALQRMESALGWVSWDGITSGATNGFQTLKVEN